MNASYHSRDLIGGKRLLGSRREVLGGPDFLIKSNNGQAIFNYQPLDSYDFRLESYLEGILNSLRHLKSLSEPHFILSISNNHIFQLVNFPQLMRFRLFFWAKTHLLVPEYQKIKYFHQKTSETAFAIGEEILQFVKPSRRQHVLVCRRARYR